MFYSMLCTSLTVNHAYTDLERVHNQLARISKHHTIQSIGSVSTIPLHQP